MGDEGQQSGAIQPFAACALKALSETARATKRAESSHLLRLRRPRRLHQTRHSAYQKPELFQFRRGGEHARAARCWR